MMNRCIQVPAVISLLVIAVSAHAQDESALAEMARKAQDPLGDVKAIMTDNTIAFDGGENGNDTSYGFQTTPDKRFFCSICKSYHQKGREHGDAPSQNAAPGEIKKQKILAELEEAFPDQKFRSFILALIATYTKHRRTATLMASWIKTTNVLTRHWVALSINTDARSLFPKKPQRLFKGLLFDYILF